ncbi:MAG: 1-acyl-sn-glycerol-3-phosphate acyltransferase [Desulfobacteraceae bacterium]|nr:1-acyl-sn-glycerol-3-phosphate acyltransferase [Desulfobacteraceae bacterium]
MPLKNHPLRKTRKNRYIDYPDRSRDNGAELPFLCYLPAHTGILSLLVEIIVFQRPRIEPEYQRTLKQLRDSGIIVFVNKYRSQFEYFFCHTRFRREGLPYPALGFDYRTLFWQPIKRIFQATVFYTVHLLRHFRLPDPYETDFFRTMLMEDHSALVSLIEEKGFYHRQVESRTDPLEYLIKMQKTLDKPIYLVPQLILYDKAPQAARLSLIDIVFGTREKPGRLRRLFMILIRPGKVLIETSEPVCLNDFIHTPEAAELSEKEQAIYLRRHLVDRINRHRQSITGPILKSRVEIMEEVLTSKQMQKTIAGYARENELSIHRAQKEAANLLDEIASSYNPRVIKLFDISLRWIIRAMFDGMVVDYEGLNRIRQASKKGPLILVPCHKSHLDYLIISFVFYHNNLPCPHVAAGRNLSFWPIGPLFRGGGAFFIRRTFKGEPLYPEVFSAYLHKILEEGFHIEFFPEGGRSRTGKLLTPKIGFLSLVVDAYLKTDWEDIQFVPIYIGYDRVLEEKAYVHEMEGGKKSPESIGKVLKARKFLKKKYGKIYINFHEPFSMNEHFGGQPNDYPAIKREERKKRLYEFGEKIISAINRISVATPHAIISATLLNCSQKRIYYKQLIANAETYMNYLLAREARLADTLYVERQNAFNSVLDTFVSNKILEKTSATADEPPANPIFKIHENRRPNLEYYKNNCVIFFVPAAYTALSILALDSFQFRADSLYTHYGFLKEFFAREFIFKPEATDETVLYENLDIFINDAILAPHPSLAETYNLTSTGFRKLHLFAGFLTPYFESYWVVLNFYMRYTIRSIFDVKDYTRKIEKLGDRMYKRNEILRKEALSRMNYKNAVERFADWGLTGHEEGREVLDACIEKVQFYRRYLPG